MYPILFQVGYFEPRIYGVLVILAFLATLWLSTKEAQRKGLDSRLVKDFAVYALVGGLIGARLYYVLFHLPHFLQNPREIFAIWRGGISIIGSLFGGFIAALWYCRRHGISILRFGDTLAPGMALDHMLGQLACLANGDMGQADRPPLGDRLHRISA